MQLADRFQITSPRFLGDPQSPRTWVEDPGDILRELPGRRVFRAVSGGERVIVKEYRPRRLRHWLRGYAENEARKALAVRDRGVPVVEPLAWARFGDGRQVLILKEEQGARNLRDVFLNERPKGHARHAMAAAVGALWAQLQNAGIRHDDPHAGNVLVRPDGSLLFSDAWDLRPSSGYLAPRERAADLARFATWFLTHGSMVDLLVFWGEYGRASQLAPKDLEDLRQRVLDRVPSAFRRLSHSRARRARRHGRDVRFGPFFGVAFEGIADDQLERLAGYAARPQRGDHVLKGSRTGWTFSDGDTITKLFLPKKATRALRDLVIGTRADRALDAAEALTHRGLKTPAILAVLRDGWAASRSVLVMERVTDAFPIEEVVDGLDPRQAKLAAARLGRTLRKMHDWGLRHRDLKQQNLLVSRDGMEVTFLDVDGVRQGCGKLDWERRARDLANLGGSLFDHGRVPLGLRLRTLDAYLAGTTPMGFAPGAFARLVIELTQRVEERRLEK
ncbi:MAG: lipopolysaccharide kinase InaA family protein [Planctomycetota bacterium]